MFLKNQSLRLLRGVGLDHVGEARDSGDIGVVVNHLDVALGYSGDDQFIVDPNADDRVSGHGRTLLSLFCGAA